VPEASPEYTIRRATAADRGALLRLLAELKVPIAGSTQPAAHRVLFDAGLKDPRLIVLVAERGGEQAGIALGDIDPKQLWRDLALRHPILLLLRIPALLRRRRQQLHFNAEPAADISGFASPRSSREWGESSPQIGHVMLFLVRPELRGRGLSNPLLQMLVQELEAGGATRIDARVARGNLPSARALHRIGLNVEDRGSYIFCTGDTPLQGRPQ
jgi:ribosomal protein S18 acetylase RimI-like enzyme